MIFALLSCVLINITPCTDTMLAVSCQRNGLDTTVNAVFQTLLTAWQAEERYRKNHNNHYLTLSIFRTECLTPSTFEAKLGCRLPRSPVTDATYAITVATSVAETDIGLDSLLHISFFKQTDTHLPLANFRYNRTQDYLYFEYIIPDTVLTLVYPPPDSLY